MKKKEIIVKWENIKIPGYIIAKMRAHKEKTKVPMVQQAEIALLQYLSKNQK